jgi:hypothetical protein
VRPRRESIEKKPAGGFRGRNRIGLLCDGRTKTVNAKIFFEDISHAMRSANKSSHPKRPCELNHDIEMPPLAAKDAMSSLGHGCRAHDPARLERREDLI